MSRSLPRIEGFPVHREGDVRERGCRSLGRNMPSMALHLIRELPVAVGPTQSATGHKAFSRSGCRPRRA